MMTRVLLFVFCLIAILLVCSPASAKIPDLESTRLRAVREHAATGWSVDVARRRARLSSLMPRVRVDTMWQRDAGMVTDYREDQIFDDFGASALDEVRNDIERGLKHRRRMGVRVELDLGGVVFDRRELDVVRLDARLRASRRALMDDVADAYFDYLTALDAILVTPVAEVRVRRQRELELRASIAELDVLTGGWFSRQLDEVERGGRS